MPLTRRQQRQAHAANLPLDPSVMVHVFSVLAELHGERHMVKASRVCRSWHERVVAMSQVEEDPDNVIGELRSGDKPYRFDRPHDCIFLPNGDICVADCDNFRLQVYSREGCYLREVKLTGGTSCPTGVATSGEALYVVEHGAHQVSKLRRASVSGHRHATAGGWGTGDGQLRHPWSICVAARRIFVTDLGNDRVSVFDTDKLTWQFSFRGEGAMQLREPRGIAIHGTELYVADHGNHRILVFSIEDAASHHCPPIRVIGGGVSDILGRFNGPSGVCISNEKLFVTELAGARLQVLSLDGLPLQCVPACGPASGVCADDDHVCITSVEGDHALTLWRTQTSPIPFTPRRSSSP